MATFSLVHGGQQGAWCFEPLIAELAGLGHRSIAIDLPVADARAGASEYADAVVESLAGVDEEPIVVGHSLGGLTIPLVAHRRPVRLLVFLCAAVPEVGLSLREAIGTQLLDERHELHLTPREQAREVFFPDCPPELQEWALDRQRAQCEKPHREVTPLQEWPPVPVAVANGLHDGCIPIERARDSALRVFGREPVELDAGHFPFLTNPPLIAESLDRLARDDERAWPAAPALTAVGTP
jgi:pimeloyl-ACP methyl ester carboxylesterase